MVSCSLVSPCYEYGTHLTGVHVGTALLRDETLADALQQDGNVRFPLPGISQSTNAIQCDLHKVIANLWLHRCVAMHDVALKVH